MQMDEEEQKKFSEHAFKISRMVVDIFLKEKPNYQTVMVILGSLAAYQITNAYEDGESRAQHAAYFLDKVIVTSLKMGNPAL